ncbi:MAG TPA: tryptophan--tRNA ligase [Terriglobales bacterium]|nr:tryptophan--tRNA ligase [Terriglobales bacterium]
MRDDRIGCNGGARLAPAAATAFNRMQIALTGIKPSGHPHLGNYLGMLRPALELAQRYRAFYFIADYHALTTLHEGRQLRELTDEVAATWLALGLDPQKTLLYRQSDVPQVMELAWILSCFTAKGWLDRAHAYKDAVAQEREATAGLYTYPVLMAADILAFGTNVVPVGRDQKQHVEICRDIALRFNHTYGDLLTPPEPLIREEVETIPGIDGRKMSKSYDNTIPLFAPGPALRKRIFQIQTDSTSVAAPKEPDAAPVFQLYRHFVAAPEAQAMAARLRAGGTGWGEVKEQLWQAVERALAEPRARYQEWLADRPRLHGVLAEGGARARAIAEALLRRVRQAVGTEL